MRLNCIFFNSLVKFSEKMKKSVAVISYLSMFLLVIPLNTLSADDLFDLQKKIKQQQQENLNNHKKLDKINADLSNIELKQSQLTLSIRDLEQQIKQNSQQIKELEQKKINQQQQIKYNQQALAQLLDFIYKNYSENSFYDQFLHLDNDPKTQFIAYFKYLNEQITDNIQQIELKDKQLSQTIADIENNQQQLNAQKNLQQQQNEQLIELKAKNITLTQELSNILNDGNIKLDNLINNERKLNDEIEKVKRIEALAKEKRKQEEYEQKQQQQLAKSIKLKGLNTKTSYNHPVKYAKIIHNFGSKQIGEIRYKGIVYSATNDLNVRAIEDGKVVLSTWLNGYGLVILIDHGKDYLSLYGYNSTVLVKLNQLVKKGQIIAEVGNSGGLGGENNTLYFEIRHKGIPQNPNIWIKN